MIGVCVIVVDESILLPTEEEEEEISAAVAEIQKIKQTVGVVF